MKTEIPQWVIEYNNANYQSSAGKAVRTLMDLITKDTIEYPSLKLTTEWLEKNGFGHITETDTFESITMPYYVKKGVILFYNAHRTEYEQSDYLIGFGEMRAGKYHCVTFKWISTVSAVRKIYEAIHNEPIS